MGRPLGSWRETAFEEIRSRAVLRNTTFPRTGLLASVHWIHIDMWRVIRSSELGPNDHIQRSESVVPI